MHAFVLIDLCCPADLGTPGEIALAGAKAGLDALIYTVDGSASLPDRDLIAEIAEDPSLATLHPAVAVRGQGYGYAVLVPNWSDSPLLAALESMSDPALIEHAARDAGGCAIPVSPRQGADGEVFREVAKLTDVSNVGSVVSVAGGSILARDLDLEDCALARRRVLAGTGPYGALENLGHYATLLPVAPGDVEALINALGQGLGLALELGTTSAPPQPKKKRRRRKRSGRRRTRGGESNGDGATKPQGEH